MSPTGETVCAEGQRRSRVWAEGDPRALENTRLCVGRACTGDIAAETGIGTEMDYTGRTLSCDTHSMTLTFSWFLWGP